MGQRGRDGTAEDGLRIWMMHMARLNWCREGLGAAFGMSCFSSPRRASVNVSDSRCAVDVMRPLLGLDIALHCIAESEFVCVERDSVCSLQREMRCD